MSGWNTGIFCGDRIMSFSGEIREELAAQTAGAAHCRCAQLTAIILMCGAVSISVFDREYLRIQTENVHVLRTFCFLVRKLAHVNPEVAVRRKRLTAGAGRGGEELERLAEEAEKGGEEQQRLTEGAGRGSEEQEWLAEEAEKVGEEQQRLTEGTSRGSEAQEERVRITYTAAVMDPQQAAQILDMCGIPEDPMRNVRKDCCRRAYLRGAFLVSGSVSDPKKSYHLEIVCANEEQAGFAQNIMRSFGLDARVVLRKEKYMVYLKEADQISDMLGLMGSTNALLNFENIRILREISGSINRQVNCETANISKTVDAAVRQIEDITFLRDHGALQKLPDNLKEAAQVRLDNPDVPLKRLGELMDPPIGKSGMNHRLMRLCQIAQDLREKSAEQQ